MRNQAALAVGLVIASTVACAEAQAQAPPTAVPPLPAVKSRPAASCRSPLAYAYPPAQDAATRVTAPPPGSNVSFAQPSWDVPNSRRWAVAAFAPLHHARGHAYRARAWLRFTCQTHGNVRLAMRPTPADPSPGSTSTGAHVSASSPRRRE